MSYTMQGKISWIEPWERCPPWHKVEPHDMPQGVHNGVYAMEHMNPVVCTKCLKFSEGCNMVQHGHTTGCRMVYSMSCQLIVLKHPLSYHVLSFCGIFLRLCQGLGDMVNYVTG